DLAGGGQCFLGDLLRNGVHCHAPWAITAEIQMTLLPGKKSGGRHRTGRATLLRTFLRQRELDQVQRVAMPPLRWMASQPPVGSPRAPADRAAHGRGPRRASS